MHRVGSLLSQASSNLAIEAEIKADGSSDIRKIDIKINTRSSLGYPQDVPIQLNRQCPWKATVALEPGLNRVLVAATNAAGKTGEASLDVYVESPPKPPRMVVLTIGAFDHKPRFQIEYADNDAVELEGFFTQKAKMPSFPEDHRAVQEATSGEVLDALRMLKSRVGVASATNGVTVIVSIESHLHEIDGKTMLLGSDWNENTADQAIATSEVTGILEGLQKEGCCVVLLLDVVHETSPGHANRSLLEWVRKLCYQKSIITLVASKDGPSGRDHDNHHGYFARAVLRSFDERSRFVPVVKGGDRFALEDFRTVVIESVKEYSGLMQYADVYIPDGLAAGFSIFEPVVLPTIDFAGNVKPPGPR